MTRRLARALVWAGVVAGWSAVPSWAGGRVLVAEERREGDERVRGSRYEVSAEGLRMTGVRGTAVSVIIYNRRLGRFYLLDTKNKTYREAGRGQILAVVEKAREAVAELEERAGRIGGREGETAAALLAAGRRLLGEKTGALAEEAQYELAGEEEGPFGAVCRRYVARRGGGVATVVWTAPPEAAGLGPEELAVLGECGALFETAVSSLTGIKETAAFLPRLRPGLYEGLPVRRARYKDGRLASDWRLVGSEAAEFPEGYFAPPEGYEKRALLD